MTSVVRMVDRLVTAGVALALLVAGGWLIGYRVNLRAARESAERLQPVVLTHTAEWPWWPAAVGGAGVTAVLLGLWLLLLHLRPAGVGGDAGAANLDRIADAVAGDVGGTPQYRAPRPAPVSNAAGRSCASPLRWLRTRQPPRCAGWPADALPMPGGLQAPTSSFSCWSSRFDRKRFARR